MVEQIELRFMYGKIIEQLRVRAVFYENVKHLMHYQKLWIRLNIEKIIAFLLSG